jgi:hypothetical protein
MGGRQRGHRRVAPVLAERVEEAPDRLAAIGAAEGLDLIAARFHPIVPK